MMETRGIAETLSCVWLAVLLFCASGLVFLASGCASVGEELPCQISPEEIAQLDDEEYFSAYFTPDLRFAVVSDVHIASYDAQIEEGRFAAFLETAYEYARGQEYTRLDGAFIAGDIGDRGSETEFSRFNAILTRHALPETKTRVILGNHEFRTDGAVDRLKDTFGYETDDEHAVVNGYHFLFLSQDERDSFSDADAMWLRTELAKAAADDPTGKRPIFVFQHEPNAGTTAGGAGVANLYDIMRPYPQVVSFAGHTHESIKDPRSIHQKDFTSVSTGGLSVYEFSMVNTPFKYAMAVGQEDGYTGTFSPYSSYPTKNMAEYWIVEADARGAIVLKGFDITGDKFVVQYRLRSVGDTSRFVYTEARADNAPAPAFAGDAMLVVEKAEDKRRLEVRIPQADENEYVNNYRVELHKANKLVDTKYALSGMFFANAPEYVRVAFTGVESGEYTLKAYAVSSWGKESAPLVSNVAFTAEEVENIILPDAHALAYDQEAVSSGEWYGRDMLEVSFGKRYAGETVTIMMEVNGNLSVQNPEGPLGIRCFFNNCLNNQKLIPISVAALSTTEKWTMIPAVVQLNENGSIWMTAEGRPSVGVYKINIQNITMIENGELVTASQASGWSGNVVRISFGEEYANKKVLVSARIAGDISTASGQTSVGFGVFADERKDKHINYITLDRTGLVSLTTFNTMTFALALNGKGEAFLGASRTNNTGGCGVITLILKDVQLLEVIE